MRLSDADILRAYNTAVKNLERFPANIPQWMDLDVSTQLIMLVNVIEAIARMRIGLSHPGMAFLMTLYDWTHNVNPKNDHEINILRLRLKIALQTPIVKDDLLFLNVKKAKHPPTLIGRLVLLDTLTSPALLEGGLVPDDYLAKLSTLILRLAKSAPYLRPEDVLFLHVVARRGICSKSRLYKAGIPPVDVTVQNIFKGEKSLGRGRFRRTAFVLECLARGGLVSSNLFQKIKCRLIDLSIRGYLKAGRMAVKDHVFPNDLQSFPNLVSIYNSSLLIRTAPYFLSEGQFTEIGQELNDVLLFRGHAFDPGVNDVTKVVATIVNDVTKYNSQIDQKSHENKWRDAVFWALKQRGFNVQIEVHQGQGCRVDLAVVGSNKTYCIEFKRFSNILKSRINRIADQLLRYGQRMMRHIIFVVIKDVLKIDDLTLHRHRVFRDFLFVGLPKEIGPKTFLRLGIIQDLKDSKDITVSLVTYSVC